jgi:hypothetical protein
MPRFPVAEEVLQQLLERYGATLQDVVVMYTTRNGNGRSLASSLNSPADVLLFVEQSKAALVQTTMLPGPGKTGA